MSTDDFEFDDEKTELPVTRIELWRALSKIRRSALSLEIMIFANRNNDEKTFKENADYLANVGLELDDLMDDLVRLQSEPGKES